ncbi:MAG: holin [Bacilli bacterium]|nr:holin [Bacilli bacterium]
MDIQVIIDMIINQGIFACLFVWLFYDTRKQASRREEKLMAIIDKHSEQLQQISDTLVTINNKIDNKHRNYK